MKVTQVGIRPTDASLALKRPALTPELLAASGARYSRNNEGLEAILGKIDWANLDKSVDSIFRMIDYGHQSIADMVPVSMFIDDISIWLAYYVWTLCPTAGGQESSTRYIKLSPDEITLPEKLGIPENAAEQWRLLLRRSFGAYSDALRIWEDIAEVDSEVARIPRGLLEDSSETARKQVERMRRNYAFDRARYFLPVAASTNMMLIMSARGWTQLCQQLLSHPLPEPNVLGAKIRDELNLAAPRMLNHACRKEYFVQGLKREFLHLRAVAEQQPSPFLLNHTAQCERPPRPFLEVYAPHGTAEAELSSDLSFHENRYAYIGESLRRTAVRFGWDAVAFAEIRDLNRHRTGTKHGPLIPTGFYSARDQIPSGRAKDVVGRLLDLNRIGCEASALGRTELEANNAAYMYWTLLGTQYRFEHLTTADKFIYEAELRTGTGAHFRYARHFRDTLALWYERFPSTRGLILEGSAEPE